MKRIILTMLVFISGTFLFSCQENLKTDQVNFPVKEHELPPAQWKAWNELKEKWMGSEYRDCLKKSDLKMSCSGCEYIYMDVILEIDKQGHLQSYTILKENVCGEKARKELQECFLKYFQEITFPPELKGWKIEAKLGTGLKC